MLLSFLFRDATVSITKSTRKNIFNYLQNTP
nr:MAG TPA: hypothetical protein [Caudoviricetes sp.]